MTGLRAFSPCFCSSSRLSQGVDERLRSDSTCSGSVGQERVAEHFVPPRVRSASPTGEYVHRWTDLDADEPGLFEHLLPALTGQPARDSAGPQINVSQSLRRDRSTVRNVRELQDASGTKDAVNLGEDGPLVGTKVEHTVRDHYVRRAVLDW